MTDASASSATPQDAAPPPGGDVERSEAVSAGVGSGLGSGIVAAIVAPFARSVGRAAEFIDRAVGRVIRRIYQGASVVPLVLGLACQSTSDPAQVAPAVPSVAPAPAGSAAKPEDTGPRQLGKFTITFYYVIGEDEVTAPPAMVAANTNRSATGSDSTDLAAITPDQVTLYDGSRNCEPIAEVSKEFASQLEVQGTGKLRDGRVVNFWGACHCDHSPCFRVTRAQWGTAGSGKPLQPFRTVAVDPKVIKLGTVLYVPLLEGRTMPGRRPWGGYVHDGCVIAEDTGGHIAGSRLDLFVGRKGYFLGLSGSGGSHAWARQVPVFDGTGICDRNGREVTRKAASI